MLSAVLNLKLYLVMFQVYDWHCPFCFDYSDTNRPGIVHVVVHRRCINTIFLMTVDAIAVFRILGIRSIQGC